MLCKCFNYFLDHTQRCNRSCVFGIYFKIYKSHSTDERGLCSERAHPLDSTAFKTGSLITEEFTLLQNYIVYALLTQEETLP